MESQSAPILIVDDQLEMTRLARRFVQRLGFHDIDEANDGPTALQFLRQKAYRVALVDLNMRPVSGTELLKALAADSRAAKPAVIIMSGSNTPDAIAAVKQFSVSGYLLKPFTLDTLKRNLVRVLGPL